VGETPPPEDPQHNLAIKAWNLLSNGMGGLEWAGLPYVCELLGIDEPEVLMARLLTIRAHRKPDNNEDRDHES
jgi:hypothetical protein